MRVCGWLGLLFTRIIRLDVSFEYTCQAIPRICECRTLQNKSVGFGRKRFSHLDFSVLC